MTGLEDIDFALTLTCPWGSIVLAHKPIENRDWPPPAWIIGKRIAIHAGKVFGDQDWLRAQEILRQFGINPIDAWEKWPHFQVRGAIIGTAVVSGFIDDADAERTDNHRSPWFFGRFGWLLEDRRPLERPVYCRGLQKLWRIPAELRRSPNA
jgi:hypothetical protein